MPCLDEYLKEGRKKGGHAFQVETTECGKA